MRVTKRMFTAALLLVVGTVFLQAGPIRPLDIRSVVNRAFLDQVAGDEQGGWTDQGSNDLRMLPAGNERYGRVPFEILSDQQGAVNACIVLGSKLRPFLENEARLELPKPEKEPFLYLFHACAFNDTKQAIAGRLTAEFSDGSSHEWRVRIGRDVQPWTIADNVSNAQRCWTEYNNNTQVSLFVSKFSLGDKELKALRFKGEEAVWMIAAVSIGDDVRVLPLRRDFQMKNDYTAPAAFDAQALAALPTDATPKNIVLVIGDGMGLGSLTLASLHAHGAPYKLAMESLPVSGLCTTHSGNADITDSAASGTALSSGYKTYNGAIGVTMNKEAMRTIAEEARDAGWAVGLMTTDSLTGATPSAFVAHVPSRSMAVEIADWYVRSDFDLMIGSSNSKPFLPTDAGGMRKDARNLLQELTTGGYREIKDPAALAALRGAPVYGFVGWPTEKDLGAMTVAALPFLASRSDKGFFIMIECSWPDGGGHSNNPDLSVKGVLCTDYVARAAVEYALEHKDTLVLVTADHETGLIHAAANRENPRRPHVTYQTTGHSQAPVPVFAFGPGAENFHGMMDNTDIPKVFARLWQLPLRRPVAE
ncbi:MAG: alkaline phosphatase [Lentisphaerae bacterium]|nr:alkaline phosphatase [Lentisphaerota bacterium]